MASKSLGVLTLDLVAKTGGFEQGMGRAERASERWRKRVDRDLKDASRSFDNSFSQITSGAAKMAGAIGVVLSANQVIQYADSWSELNARVANVVGPGQEADRVMRSIAATARSTYSSLDQTAEAFLNNATALTELGYSTEDQLQLSDALNNALVISATRGQQAESVMNALSKGMAQGVLRGDNWNTVLQSGGRIVQALADGLGVTTIELRKMAADGLLTTEKVVSSLTSQTEKLRKESGDMAATFSDGVGQIGNSLLALVGITDQSTGASSALAESLVAVADAISPFDDTGNLKVWADNLHFVADAATVLAIVLGSRVTGAAGASAVSFAIATKEAIRYQAALASMAGVSTTAAARIAVLSTAARTASAAMAVLGGPAGTLLAIAGTLTYLAVRNREAGVSFDELSAAVDGARDSFDSLSQAQAAVRILGVQEALSATEVEARNAAAQMETYQRRLQMHPGSKKADEWNEALIRATGRFDELSTKANQYRKDLELLEGVMSRVQDGNAGADAQSDAFLKLEAQVKERIALIGKSGDAAKLRYQLEAGTLDGISEAEARALIVLNERYEALQRGEQRQEQARKAAESTVKAISNEITALERAATTWGMSANEAKLYDLTVQGATDTQLMHAQAVMRNIEAMEQQSEAAQKAIEDQKRINQEARGIAESLLTEEEMILASYERRRQIVLDNTQITGDAQTELLRRLEEQRNEELLEINGGYWERWLAGAEDALTSFDQLAGSVVENFQTQFGNAFEAMIFDAETLDDAVKGMAESMLRSVVNALGQMAAQWLAYQAVQLLVGKTTQSSAATAATGNAYAGVMQAGISAFASTAAIPIVGPVLAPAAMTAAIAATSPMAAAVSTFSLMGMAHEGIESVPQTGTWLLEKGERVTTASTSAKLDRTLDNIAQRQAPGAGAGTPTIQQHFTVTGSADESTLQAIRDAARQGAEEGYKAVYDDVRRNGPIRQMIRSN